MRALMRVLATVVVALSTGCQSGRSVIGSAAFSAPPEPVELDRYLRVIGPTGEETTLERMLDALADADAVFLGETHLDEVTHDVERAVLEGLADRHDDRVVLAMEMFGTDVQDAIDDYMAGRIDEAAFLERSRPWRNYRTGYRALLETARRRGLPVVGSNIPVGLRRKVTKGGAEAFESLEPDERALVPPELHTNSTEYWKRFERAVAGHMGQDDAPAEPDPQAYLYSGQSLWDNTMGWSCARALESHPDHVVVHVNGGFHSKYGQGTVEQFLKRRPGATVATVAIIPAADLNTLDIRQAGRVADYLVFAQARARGIQEGFHAVEVSRETRYRIAVPETETSKRTLPLLIWLCEDGLRAADAETYWQTALGDEAAVVTVEPTYIGLADDLHLAGRWYWPETFHGDVGGTIQALELILGYMERHFPVDTSRVVVAGAGTGATIVASAAIDSDRLPVEALAVEPRVDSKLIERSLPDLPPATTRLTIVPAADDLERWQGRAAGYRNAGLDTEVAVLDQDVYREAEHRVRELLGLAPQATTAGRRVVVATVAGSPLARHWARLAARRLERDGVDVTLAVGGDLSRIDLDDRELHVLAFRGETRDAPAGSRFIAVADFADARAVPVPSGPFGGTTLLVVPRGVPTEDREAWVAIAEGGAMHEAHSRFHRLVVAFEDRDPGLADAMARLREQGRSNVLVVPAVFCADAETMRRMRDQVSEHAGQMSIAWLPGLGGQLAEGD